MLSPASGMSSRGHRLDSTTDVILGLDPEGHQPRVIPMGFSHGVGAGSLEVEVKAIEGAEVWVTPSPARGDQSRDALGLGTAGPTALLGAAAQGLTGFCSLHPPFPFLPNQSPSHPQTCLASKIPLFSHFSSLLLMHPKMPSRISQDSSSVQAWSWQVRP
uniref:Uncharacterized protein n=1 Tax=Corvus moneduloides TaxID=1196302 RepID=A0A8U7NXS4_CORMO